MTYQKTTGTLSPGAHPGSYNGQDAYNDMLITDGMDELGRRTDCANINAKQLWGGQRMPDKDNSNAVTNRMVVRRLTPTECERLQGYPDGWTLIGVEEEDGERYYTDTAGKRKKVTDSARYKALGNSICLPFWFWLIKRISAQYARTPTMCSLFDGIGGFPLCWERVNGKGTALWASEIEEFPIAVTKEHFKEDE